MSRTKLSAIFVCCAMLAAGSVAQGQWTEPVMVDSYSDTVGVNVWGWDWCPFITADGSKMYLASDRGVGVDFDLYVSTWTGEMWSDPVRLPFCIEGNDERNPAANATNDTLYFISWAPGWDIFWVFRTGESDTSWGAPERMPAPINSSGIEFSVIVTPDNERLLFSSSRTGGMGGEDIYGCRRDPQTPTGWGDPFRLPGFLNTWRVESYPTMGLDTTELFFWRDDAYLYVSHLTESGWTEGERLPDIINRIVQSDPTETTPCITSDGRRLYFASRYGSPPTVKDIWYSERTVSAPDIPERRQGLVPSLQVYPNPARDGITVVSTHPLRRISLFNLLGQRIGDLDNTSLRNPVYMSLRSGTMSLPSGSYFLTLFGGDEPITIRFMIEK